MNPNGCTSQGYEPFMLGNSYGVGVSPSAPNMTSRGSGGRQNHSVQHCLQWPEFSGAGQTGYNQPGMSTSGFACSGVVSPQSYSRSPVGRAPAPRAFLSAAGPGRGAGEGQPMNIPCQIAPLGTNPASMIQPLNPITVKVTAPQPMARPDGSSGPMTFTLNPQDIYRSVL